MGIRVLLADDHAILREGLKALLGKAADVEVVGEAGDGNAAVERALALRPDVVVMDLTMPGLSGAEVTRRILAAEPGARILVLSMLQDRSCVVESLKAGAKGYLLKNCVAEELLVAIRALAAGESYLCAKITELVVEDYARSLTGDGGPAPSYSELSPRELEVLRLIADGQSTKEIAYALNLSVKTIDVHRGNIMRKLQLNSIAALTKYAVREGLTPLD